MCCRVLKNIKQGFKITIYWNKYRPEITTQSRNNDLDHLVNLTFRNINRLFVLWFKNGNNHPTKNFFYEYYMPLVDNKPFFDQPVEKRKNIWKTYLNVKKQ